MNLVLFVKSYAEKQNIILTAAYCACSQISCNKLQCFVKESRWFQILFFWTCEFITAFPLIIILLTIQLFGNTLVFIIGTYFCMVVLLLSLFLICIHQQPKILSFCDATLCFLLLMFLDNIFVNSFIGHHEKISLFKSIYDCI